MLSSEIRIQFLVFVDSGHDVVHKDDGNPPFEYRVIASNSNVIKIVPAVGMERIVNERRAKQKANLISCHSYLNLIKIFLFDQVALGNVGAIHATAAEGESGQYQGK